MELLLGFNVEVLHNSCNTCTHVLPDMYTLIPRAIGSRDRRIATYSYTKNISILQISNRAVRLLSHEVRVKMYSTSCTLATQPSNWIRI